MDQYPAGRLHLKHCRDPSASGSLVPMKRIPGATLTLVLAAGVVPASGLVVGSVAVPASGAEQSPPAAQATACKRPARGFVPDRARIPALGRTVRVIQVPRTRDNAVGAGPVTESGKWLMAMDPHNKPASRRGRGKIMWTPVEGRPYSVVARASPPCPEPGDCGVRFTLPLRRVHMGELGFFLLGWGVSK